MSIPWFLNIQYLPKPLQIYFLLIIKHPCVILHWNPGTRYKNITLLKWTYKSSIESRFSHSKQVSKITLLSTNQWNSQLSSFLETVIKCSSYLHKPQPRTLCACLGKHKKLRSNSTINFNHTLYRMHNYYPLFLHSFHGHSFLSKSF